jgi:hypothetical protein
MKKLILDSNPKLMSDEKNPIRVFDDDCAFFLQPKGIANG